MKKKPIKDVAASVHQRLLNKAHETGRSFNELLQYFAMERFLYRLSKSPHAKKFVLKGALMFTVWKAPLSRPTMDIDLLGSTDKRIEAITSLTREICSEDVEPDGIVFDADSIRGEHITEDADYEGVRLRFIGHLGNARIVMQLDIGFHDIVVPAAKLISYPIILDLPIPKLRGYSMESMIAEKFEAMVKLGKVNSRMKDFFDIWYLSRQFNFDGELLVTAVNKTFTNRGTKVPAQPIALTSDFAREPDRQNQWSSFIRRTRLENIPGRLTDVVAEISSFLSPLCNALASGKSFRGIWKAPGPWSL
ncbi:MAG: nucleotidyl transferase AbiEii/AbiGii toxin family protein [candidate division Zixibacteria bacterium]|nr:nucleotidyl transferase AbiEii/AbiGii toxin family protein [candidate division Zixibacteria bacterium]